MGRKTNNGGPSEEQQRNPEQPHLRQLNTGNWGDNPEIMNEEAPPQYDENIIGSNLRQDNAEVQARVTGTPPLQL